MSKRYNNAGRELVVDRLIELKRRSSSQVVSSIKQVISGQQVQKDLDALKDALSGIASDGVISAYEKPGLKREWASLQNSYISVAEQFTSDDELKDNPAFITLRNQYVSLSELMDKILADMDSDYTGDEVNGLSDAFVSLYQQLTVCQSVLNTISDFLRNYTIGITGSREILGDTQLTAGIYRGGTEQQNPEFIDGSNYTWRRLDEADSFTPQNGKSIILNSEDLPVSPCRFSVTWEDKEEQETGLSLVFELSWGTIKQYAWSDAFTVDELQGMMPSSWYDDPPLQPEDKEYLWRRESRDNGKTWQYFRENGESGGAPQYFYKYTKTNEPDAYKGGGILFTYRNKIFAVGSTLLGAGMAGWLDHVPEGAQYQDDYLWTKIVHADGTVDIIPPAQKGENAKDIRIVASQETYKMSTRGMVQIDQEFTFALQRWYVNGAATWTVSPDPAAVTDDLEIIEQDNPDILKLKIKTGSYLSQFTVSVSCEGFEATRDLTVLGINGGEESPWYFKVYPEDPNGAMPVYNRETGVVDFGNSIWPTVSPEGNLITGDYILYKTKVIQNSSDTEGHIEPVPYYFVEGEGTGDAGHWEMLDSDSPYYSEAMGTILADVVNMDDMPVTVGALYGFFQNFAAQNAFIDSLWSNSAFIDYLESQYIKLKGSIYGGAYDSQGNNPTGGLGFFLGSNGVFRAIQAYLKEATIEGEFSCYDSSGIVMKTQKGSSSTTNISCSSPQRWSVDDALEAIAEGSSGTGTFDGDTVDYKRPSSSSPATIVTMEGGGWFSSFNQSVIFGHSMTISFTLIFKADLRFETTGIKIYLNETRVFYERDFENWDQEYNSDNRVRFFNLSVKPNDVVRVTMNTTTTYYGCDVEIGVTDTDSIVLIYDGGLYQVIGSGEYYSYSASLGTFISSMHIVYAVANGWANGLPSSGVTYALQPGNMCVINGETLEVASAYKTSSTGTLTIYTASGGSYDFDLTHSTEEGDSQGWYEISGTLKIISEQRGIVAETLIPAKSTADIGTPGNPFDNGYFSQINVANIVFDDRTLTIGDDGVVRVV